LVHHLCNRQTKFSVNQETLYVLPANGACCGTGKEQEEKSGFAEDGDSKEHGERTVVEAMQQT